MSRTGLNLTVGSYRASRRFADVPSRARRSDSNGSRPPGGPLRSMLILLSLNFMLLSFFIVLSGSSAYDQARVNDTVAEVRATFAGRDEPGTGARGEVEENFRARVSNAFISVLPTAEVQLGGGSDRVDVMVPVAALFESPAMALRPGLPLLDRVRELLITPPTGYRFELIVASPVLSDETSLASAAARAEAVARELTARGLDSALISIGSELRVPVAVPQLKFSFLVLDADEESAVGRFARSGS